MYQLTYNLMFTSKFALTGAAREVLESIVEEMCAEEGLKLLQMEISIDHLFLSVSPDEDWAIGLLVHHLMKQTSEKLKVMSTEIKFLCRRYSENSIWLEDQFFVTSAGNIRTYEQMKELSEQLFPREKESNAKVLYLHNYQREISAYN